MCDYSDHGRPREEYQEEDVYDASHQEDRVVHVFRGVRQVQLIYNRVESRHKLRLIQLVIVLLQYIHEQDRQVDHADLEGDGDEAGD